MRRAGGRALFLPERRFVGLLQVVAALLAAAHVRRSRNAAATTTPWPLRHEGFSWGGKSNSLAQPARRAYLLAIKFAIKDTGMIFVDATATPPTLSNDDAEADCTIRLSEDRLTQLIDGRLSPTLAYTLGQIKVEGSLGVAMKLAGLLEG